MEAGALEQVCRQLVEAVQVSLDPGAATAERRAAYEACELFKETSPWCAQCGQALARLPNAPLVRHLGLQLLEHCVRHRWNALDIHDKLFIKESSMAVLREGTLPMLEEQPHIKDAAARLVVEMVKREWPQQWPSFLDEMNALCSLGPTQAELALLVFRRLAEDVAVLQTLESNQRRKDIHQALNANMESIFRFFLQIISANLGLIGCPDSNKVPLKLCEVVLKTLSTFVEWVSCSALVHDNGQLLFALCALLRNSTCEPVLNAAAECLVQILNRKGIVEERQFAVLLLQSAVTLECVCEAAERVLASPPSEASYLFLKQLTQVLTGLGSQLQYLLSKDPKARLPANFAAFLEALLQLTRHPSHVVTKECNALWTAFFRTEAIAANPDFLRYALKWIHLSVPKCMKVGVPGQAECPSSVFAAMDFDSEEEFLTFFHRYRADLQECLHQATLALPLEAFAYASSCLRAVMERPVPEGCTVLTPVVLEWDAVTTVLEAVLSKILVCRQRPPPAAGLELMALCLRFDSSDPLVVSFVLSSISALFVFLSMDAAAGAALLPQVLRKIFAALVFTVPGQKKENRSRAVKNVRRHAASLMVKLAQKYPLLLLPLFDDIKNTVDSLSEQLSQMELVTLQEALIVVCNHFNDFERQSAFIGGLVGGVAAVWHSLAGVVGSAEAFAAFVGLDREPVEPSSDDTNGQNRALVSRCTRLLFAVTRRSLWPQDPDLQTRGGFVAHRTPAGLPVLRNPAAPHLLPLLPQLLALCRTLNDLWKPHALAALSSGYKKAHDMLEESKRNALGTTVSVSLMESLQEQRPVSPLERMQTFLATLHEECYLTLGAACASFGAEFYAAPQLAEQLLASTLTDLDCVPDYRLRSLVRPFLKPFVALCPSAHFDTLAHVLASFCPYMYHRLSTKWQHIASLYDNGQIENPETCDAQCCEAVLEDNLNRLLTREYMEVLRAVLIGSAAVAAAPTDDASMDCGADAPAKFTDVLSELGKHMLSVDPVCHAIFACLLKSFSWSDNTVSQRATQLTLAVVRQLFAEGKVSEQAAQQVVCAVLHGLEVQGEHDSANASFTHLGAALYDLMRPAYPSLRDILLSIPGCTLDEVNRIDEKILGGQLKGSKREKAVRDAFRKISAKIANEGTSKMFQKKVSIKELPPIERRAKPSVSVVDAHHNSLDLLFGPS